MGSASRKTSNCGPALVNPNRPASENHARSLVAGHVPQSASRLWAYRASHVGHGTQGSLKPSNPGVLVHITLRFLLRLKVHSFMRDFGSSLCNTTRISGLVLARRLYERRDYGICLQFWA